MDWLTAHVLAAWVAVGLVAGLVGEKLFYRGRMRSRTFGSLVRTVALGMAGAAMGIGAGVLLGVPGARQFGLMMIALAILGTLALIFIVSRLVR